MFLIVMFGLISLFSDLTYQAGRSPNGPFLGILGADADPAKGVSRTFWIYSVFTFMVSMGFINFTLLSFPLPFLGFLGGGSLTVIAAIVFFGG